MVVGFLLISRVPVADAQTTVGGFNIGVEIRYQPIERIIITLTPGLQ